MAAKQRAQYDGNWTVGNFEVATAEGVKSCVSGRHSSIEGPFVCGPFGVYCTDVTPEGEEWVLTHTPTGLRIGDAWWTHEDTFRAVDQIAFIIDWWGMTPATVKNIPQALRQIIHDAVYVQDDVPF